MKGTNSHDRNEKCIKILIDQLGRKRGLERPMHRWTDNIKVNLKYIIYICCKPFQVLQDRRRGARLFKRYEHTPMYACLFMHLSM